MTTFINSLDPGLTPFLERLAKEAEENEVPIIRRDMQSFLKVLLTIQQPHRILEIGTAVGFSAILMAVYGPKDAQITTIESYQKRIPAAQENFTQAGFADRIHLLAGDAAEILPELSGSYDLIFMDAAKGQYPVFLEDCIRLLAPGGLLISDNVLQDGDLIESHYLVERRNRTIYRRMRAYLYTLKHHPLLETAILPVGDGAAVSVRRSADSSAEEALQDCIGKGQNT